MEQKDQKIGKYEDGSEEIIGALIAVHRALGPGLLESAYEACFCHELHLRGLAFERQRPVGITYKGLLAVHLEPDWPSTAATGSTCSYTAILSLS